MRRREFSRISSLVVVLWAVHIAGGAGCSFQRRAPGVGADGTGGARRPADAGGSDVVPTPSTPPLDDFPADPTFTGPDVPRAAPDLFASTPSRTDGAPCVVSPEMGTLLPRNWLRPRFEYRPAGDEN